MQNIVKRTDKLKFLYLMFYGNKIKYEIFALLEGAKLI